MYFFDSRVRYSEIGEDKKMTLNSLLNYFQDCTTFHSASLGRGMEILEKTGCAWVLSSWQVCINRFPTLGENIRVCTWPYEFRGFYGSRNFRMLTEQDEVLAYANSLWSFLDMRTGRPTRVTPEESQAYPLEEKLDMEYAPRKILIPKGMEKIDEYEVKKHHLDTNHHVNNVQYVRMAQDYLPADFCIGQMRAEYKKQALLGDRIIIMMETAGDICTVALCDEEQKPYAVVEFQKSGRMMQRQNKENGEDR